MGVTRTYEIELAGTSRAYNFEVEVELDARDREAPPLFEIISVEPIRYRDGRRVGPVLGPEAVCPRTLAELTEEVMHCMTPREIAGIDSEADARAREEALGL